jgi:hypothetical protein
MVVPYWTSQQWPYNRGPTAEAVQHQQHQPHAAQHQPAAPLPHNEARASSQARSPAGEAVQRMQRSVQSLLRSIKVTG